jgi:hypothetical protein
MTFKCLAVPHLYKIRNNSVKWTVSGDFFHGSPSPKPLKITLGSFRFFSKIRGDIRKSRCTTGVNDTGVKDIGGKIAAGINDIGGKFCHQFRPLVLLTPVANNGNNIRLQTP